MSQMQGLNDISGISTENTLLAVAGFFTLPYDNMVITYVPAGNGAGEIQTVTTKLGLIVVQTLTITYNANNEISTISVA
jgi:energy-converting hydrogenase Eha subunit G